MKALVRLTSYFWSWKIGWAQEDNVVRSGNLACSDAECDKIVIGAHWRPCWETLQSRGRTKLTGVAHLQKEVKEGKRDAA